MINTNSSMHFFEKTYRENRSVAWLPVLTCGKQDKDIVLDTSPLLKDKIKHCPICGEKMEVENP